MRCITCTPLISGLILSCVSVDVFDTQRGLLIDNTPRPFSILNGVNIVTYDIVIRAEEIQFEISDTFSTSRVTRQCDHASSMNASISNANTEMTKFVTDQLKALEVDNRVKARNDRSFAVAIGTAAATAVISNLSSRLVDRLFTSKNTAKLEGRINSLTHDLELKNAQIKANSMELCLLTHSLFEEKLEAYVDEFKREINSQVNELIEMILRDELTYANELEMCQTINPGFNSALCAVIVKNMSFRPRLVKITHNESGGVITLELLVPLVTETHSVYPIYPIGVPVFDGANQILLTPIVPKYLSVDNITFDGDLKDGLGLAGEYIQGQKADFNCLGDTSGCDVDSKVVADPFVIQVIDGHTIITTWTKCRFEYTLDGRKQFQQLDVGSHQLVHTIGQLHCGAHSVSLFPSSLKGKLEVTKSKPNFDLVSGVLEHQISIFDTDHQLHHVQVVNHFNLAQLIFGVTLISFVVLVIIIYRSYSKIRKSGSNYLGAVHIL